MASRKTHTFVIKRKNGYSVKRHGIVQFSSKDLSAVEGFLSWYDPELAARRANAPRINALIEKLIEECNCQ